MCVCWGRGKGLGVQGAALGLGDDEAEGQVMELAARPTVPRPHLTHQLPGGRAVGGVLQGSQLLLHPVPELLGVFLLQRFRVLPFLKSTT